jgi:hypothetical protein
MACNDPDNPTYQYTSGLKNQIPNVTDKHPAMNAKDQPVRFIVFGNNA